MYQVGKQSSAWPLYSPHEESIQLQWKVQSKELHYSFRYFCCSHMKSHEGHEKSQEIRDSRQGWNRLKIFGKKTLGKIFHGPSVAEAKLFQLSSSYDYYYYYYFTVNTKIWNKTKQKTKKPHIELRLKICNQISYLSFWWIALFLHSKILFHYSLTLITEFHFSKVQSIN